MRSATLKWIIIIGLSHAVFIADVPALEQVQWSPRAYCQTMGGTISETGNPHIFICCYVSKQKCVMNDEQKRYSRRISVTPEEWGFDPHNNNEFRRLHSDGNTLSRYSDSGLSKPPPPMFPTAQTGSHEIGILHAVTSRQQ